MTEERNPSVAVAYLRSAAIGQLTKGAEHLPAFEAQKAKIERWAQSHGVLLIIWRVDPGESGLSSLETRPGFLRAMRAVEHHSAGWIVVSSRDRLARSVTVLASAERMIGLIGARLAVADEDAVGSGKTNYEERLRVVNPKLDEATQVLLNLYHYADGCVWAASRPWQGETCAEYRSEQQGVPTAPCPVCAAEEYLMSIGVKVR